MGVDSSLSDTLVSSVGGLICRGILRPFFRDSLSFSRILGDLQAFFGEFSDSHSIFRDFFFENSGILRDIQGFFDTFRDSLIFTWILRDFQGFFGV